MRVAAFLFAILVLSPSLARAECDADAVGAVVASSSAPIARMLRAHPESDRPGRWRAGAVTVGEPVIAPILADGCSGAILEYAWTASDRRAPAFSRWRHGVAVLAVRDGRVRLVARRALEGPWDTEPPSHGVSFLPGAEPVIVVSLGGAGGSSGWGSQQRFRLVGRRLVPMDGLRVGSGR